MIPNSFTFRQTLQILIPGTYFVSMIIPLINHRFDLQNSGVEFQNVVFITIFSILVGICIYAIEIPKQIWFFKKYLPTERIDKREYHDYFSFYDEKVSQSKREIIERYTGLFHLCINVAFASVILLIVYIFSFGCSMVEMQNFLPITISLISSLLGSILMIYGHKKIKYEFENQLKSYKKHKEREKNIDSNK